MKKIICLFVFNTCLFSNAQSFLDIKDKKDRSLYEDNSCNIMLRHTSVRRVYGNGVGGFTANINMRYAKANKGGVSWHYDNPTLGDFIWLLANLKKTVEGSYGSGFIGWLQTYLNVIAKDKFILAPGFSYGDYIYATKRIDGKGVLEPNGYYFHLGPNIKTSHLLTKSIWIDTFTGLDMGLMVARAYDSGGNQKIDDYPKPWFLNLGFTVYHSSKLFFSMRYNQIIDRGINHDKANRLDISLGYQFLR